jgi:hypothetical protein
MFCQAYKTKTNCPLADVKRPTRGNGPPVVMQSPTTVLSVAGTTS